MAFISRRPRADGTVAWRVQGRETGGRQTTTITFDTEDDAIRHLDAVDRLGFTAARKLLERHEQGDANGPTLKRVLEDYSSRAHDITAGTKDDYKRILERSGINDALGELPASFITEDDVHAWVSDRAATISESTGAGISPKTIRNEHGLLSTLLAHAVSRGWCDTNAAKGVRLPSKAKHDMLVLTNDQYAAIHAKMDDAYKPFVEFLAVTGTRWGEATALQWRDINTRTSPPRVTIRRAWKKGVKGEWSVEGLPKTSAGSRSFTIPKRLVERLGDPGAPGDLVFKGATGKAIQHTNFHARKWVRACEAAGVDDPRPRIHDLRHYMASTLLSAGVPIHAISRRLGHEKISTTVDVYGFLTPDMAVAGLDTMADVLALTPTAPKLDA